MDFRMFQQNLENLIPVLKRLTQNGTRIIWMEQYRAHDIQNLEVEHNEVSTPNVMHMNRLARSILRFAVYLIWPWMI